MRQILSTYGILKLAPPAVAAARHVHVSRPRCSCPSCSKYQKGHVRNEHQHVRSAGGSSDNVSGLKFPDSPSCATTQPSFVSCLPPPLKLLAKTFAVVVVAVVAAAVTCVASVSVCSCVCGGASGRIGVAQGACAAGVTPAEVPLDCCILGHSCCCCYKCSLLNFYATYVSTC